MGVMMDRKCLAGVKDWDVLYDGTEDVRYDVGWYRETISHKI